MTIDIRSLQNQRQVVGQRPDTADARPRDVADGKPGGEADGTTEQVRLSPEAQRLKSLQEDARTASEVDMATVEQVRREIAEGRYHVDARKLAGSILSLERELLG